METKKIILTLSLVIVLFFLSLQEPTPQLQIEENRVEMIIPGVDQNGNGLTGNLVTNVRKGSGLILININDIFIKSDTQNSARLAVKAASTYTNISSNDIDMIYSFDIKGSSIEGYSSGMSMAISVATLLLNKSLNKSVSITGAIKEDGILIPADSIEEKIKASKNNNIEKFLVGTNQIYKQNIKRKKTCTDLEEIEYCKVEYLSEKEKINNEINIDIVEVKNLEQALEHFLID